MKITFIGAARTVTGSMHLIETNGKKFLLDCGMYQGKRKLAFEINRTFDLFDPKELDFIILSHAHIDHSGNLPTIVRKGFKGDIYSTFATRDLAAVMLQDSAHIQEKDVEYVNKRRKKRGQNPFEPLYTQKDALTTLSMFVGMNYHQEREIAPGIKLTFFDAGHILGSASVLLTIREDDKVINLGFSGDLGRNNLPILKDPEHIPDVDLFISESTYGGRMHENALNSEAQLEEIVRRAMKNKSKIIIPAFSVGRTQEIVFALNRIYDRTNLVPIPTYVDSPLSVNATDVFRMHPECFDYETVQFLLREEDPFGFKKLTYITDVEDSKRLNEKQGPLIIISSSGMCEAGRILHHLANNVGNPNNIILMVGYSAENTLGRKIIDGEKKINIFGDEYDLKAEVIVMESFSAHADANELYNYADKFDKSRMQNFILVHGEYEQQQIFKEKLHSLGFLNVTIPARGETITI
ncbi:MAG: MBL fold metallo-hydrolase [Melioribacteraceae bacterium]|nr:MBL fold metallo-hydrolase [Melioribacteraceae bacterium]